MRDQRVDGVNHLFKLIRSYPMPTLRGEALLCVCGKPEVAV
jgi:hypothetical protein